MSYLKAAWKKYTYVYRERDMYIKRATRINSLVLFKTLYFFLTNNFFIKMSLGLGLI
jgi:hypothetical protein